MRLEKTAYLGRSRFLLFNRYYSGGQIKEDEVGGACSTYDGEERSM